MRGARGEADEGVVEPKPALRSIATKCRGGRTSATKQTGHNLSPQQRGCEKCGLQSGRALGTRARSGANAVAVLVRGLRSRAAVARSDGVVLHELLERAAADHDREVRVVRAAAAGRIAVAGR